MSNYLPKPITKIGLRLDEEGVKGLLGEQEETRVVLGRDRFPSNVEILSRDSVLEARAKMPMSEVEEALYQVWEGIGGEVARALKFDVYAEEEQIELALVLDIDNFDSRLTETLDSLELRDLRGPLPTHTVVCEEWSSTWAGLVVPDNFAIGIEGLSKFTLNPDGSREVQDIL